MILSKGRATKKLPEAVEPHTAELLVAHGEQTYLWRVMQVRVDEIRKMRDKSNHRATPVAFAVYGLTLELYPTPDKKYSAVFRYCPAMKEI